MQLQAHFSRKTHTMWEGGAEKVARITLGLMLAGGGQHGTYKPEQDLGASSRHDGCQ